MAKIVAKTRYSIFYFRQLILPHFLISKTVPPIFMGFITISKSKAARLQCLHFMNENQIVDFEKQCGIALTSHPGRKKVMPKWQT